MSIVVLGLLMIGMMLGGFTLGIIGFFKAQRLERNISEIKKYLAGLPNVAVERKAEEKIIEVVKVEPKVELRPEATVEKTEAVAEAVVGSGFISQAPTRDIEHNLASRWFVWVGGVAVDRAVEEILRLPRRVGDGAVAEL